MSSSHKQDDHHADLAKKIGSKADRKLKARRNAGGRTWFGLGLMGLVGWSIAIPTVIGILAGIWIDNTFHSPFSWTLMLLVVGVLIGCLNVWYWLRKEAEEMREDESDQKGGSEDV